LHEAATNGDGFLEGRFLVRVDRANYRWHPQRPFYSIRFAVLEPAEARSRTITGKLYCTSKALWRLNWFLRDFDYDSDLLNREELDEQALVGLRGIVHASRKRFGDRCFQNLEGFAPATEWATATNNHSSQPGGGRLEQSDDLQL